MSSEQREEDLEAVSDTSAKQESLTALKSRLESFGWALVRYWGMIFRTLFIPFVGIIGYFWIDPKSIGNTPFAELTLNQVFDNLFAMLIVLGCIYWFFNFPDQTKTNSTKDNPYVTWGQFGATLILLVSLVLYWLSNQ